MKSTPWNPDGISFNDVYGSTSQPKEVKPVMFVVWNKFASAYIDETGCSVFQLVKAKKFDTKADAEAFIAKSNRKNSWIVKNK